MTNDKNTTIFQSWSPKQKEVWACELEFWAALKAGDVEKYLSLWHADALLWPNWVEHPVEKLFLETHVKKELKPSKAIINLDPEAIRIFHNHAIVFYTSDYFERKDRIVHVWVYEHDKWLIIGGMSGRP